MSKTKLKKYCNSNLNVTNCKANGKAKYTLCIQHCTVLYCIVLSAELNDRPTLTVILNFQTVLENERHNTQSLYSTVLYSTVLPAEQNDRHTVTASLMFQTVTQTENQNTPSV